MCAEFETVEHCGSLPVPVGKLRLREMDWCRDRHAVLSFQYETYEHNFPGFQVTDEFLCDFSDQLRRAIRNRWERAAVLVDQSDHVWGFIWMALISTMVDDWIGYIKNIYVAPELRGQGYARLLLEEADRWFRAHNATKASLDASVCNSHAIAVYEAAGYTFARVRMEKTYHDA